MNEIISQRMNPAKLGIYIPTNNSAIIPSVTPESPKVIRASFLNFLAKAGEKIPKIT